MRRRDQMISSRAAARILRLLEDVDNTQPEVRTALAQSCHRAEQVIRDLLSDRESRSLPTPRARTRCPELNNGPLAAMMASSGHIGRHA